MFKITKNWYNLLGDEFSKSYFIKLQQYLNTEYNNAVVFPNPELVFNALNLVPYDKLKVVIIGQDPYHEKGQAQGLAFSVPKNFKVPPSLVNIYKEIESDLGIKKDYGNGDLTEWAKQGVLLLNTVLTVREGMANSHKGKGWEQFVTQVVKLLNERQDKIVFVLWGGNARTFETMIDKSKHSVLKCAHPSPLSAYNGFFGCKHFSKINEILIQEGKEIINW